MIDKDKYFKSSLFTTAIVLVVTTVYFLTTRKEKINPFAPLLFSLTGLGFVFWSSRAKEQKKTLGKIFIESKTEIININGKDLKLTFTPFFNPYDRNRRTTYNEFSDDTKGLYFIRDSKTKEVVYIGHSLSNLYKTMYRHFQEWQDPRQYRATYPKYGYEVSLATTKAESAIPEIEKYFILSYRPKDNEQKYEQYTIDFEESDTINVPDEEVEVIEEPPF